MEISINGKPADIVLEKEETVGDILIGLENWLQGTGSRLSGITIDGAKISAKQIDQALAYELKKIKTIDISISSWDELAIDALIELKEICNLYNNSAFAEYDSIKKHWEESAAAAFLSTEIAELHQLAILCFSGQGISAGNLLALADERIRELQDPAGVLESTEKSVSEIALRMEELPLDVQTGKDGRAAETVQLFSHMGEKLFRLLRALELRKPGFESIKIEGSSIKEFINDFSAALGELNAAYGNQDMVLIGDLAEYEMAPRIIKLFSALKDFSLTKAE